ncbi:hypothetical protein TNCV_3909561 [Trichonephila clavipes]|nr:hypothetical protein TNCV_3909561 [Trichonephila clavipes]
MRDLSDLPPITPKKINPFVMTCRSALLERIASSRILSQNVDVCSPTSIRMDSVMTSEASWTVCPVNFIATSLDISLQHKNECRNDMLSLQTSLGAAL